MSSSRRDTNSSKDFTPIFTWGSNEFGQLGLNTIGETYPQVRSTSLSVVITQISAGQGHALFLSREGYVYSTGLNSEGQLGISKEEQQQPIIMKTIPSLIVSLKALQIIQVSCGGFHSAAVSSNGLLLTWGNNESGQLGTGNCRNSSVPQIVDLRQNNPPKMVSCGLHNTLVLTESGAVVGFGDGRYGQFGNELLVQHKQKNSEPGLLEKQYIFPSPVQILPGSNDWVSISAGATHCLLLSKSGVAYSLGDNSFHQLGYHHPASHHQEHLQNLQNPSYSYYQVDQDSIRFVQIQAGQKQPISAGLSVQGDLYLWGSGFFGECSTPKKFNCLRGNLIDFSLGDTFVIMLDRYGNVYVWGQNDDQGQLGLGQGNNSNQSQISTPMKVRELKKKDNIQRVFAGGNSLFALGEDWIHERETKTHRQQEIILSQQQQFLSGKKVGSDGYNSQDNQSCLEDREEGYDDDDNNGVCDIQATNKSLDRLSIDDSQIFQDFRASSVGVSNQKSNEKQKMKKFLEKYDNSKNSQSSRRELANEQQFNTEKYKQHQWEQQQQQQPQWKQTWQGKGLRNTALLSKYLSEHTRRRSSSLIHQAQNKTNFLNISGVNSPSQRPKNERTPKSQCDCGVRMKYEKLKVKAKRMQLERDDLAEKLTCERDLNRQLQMQQSDHQLMQEQLQQQLLLLEKELISDREAFRVKISQLKARIPSVDRQDALQSSSIELEKQQQQQQLKRPKNKDNSYLKNQNTIFSFGNNHSIPSPPVKDYAEVSSKPAGYTYDQDQMKLIGNSSNRSNYSSYRNSSRERNTLGRSSNHREKLQKQQQQYLEASMISTAAHSFSNTPGGGGVGSRPPHSPLSKTADQLHYY